MNSFDLFDSIHTPHSQSLDRESNSIILQGPVVPYSVKIVANGLILGVDDGTGGFNFVFFKTKFSVNYATGELSYSPAFEAGHILSVEWKVKNEFAKPRKHFGDTFTCITCGAPGQRHRCSKCGHYPGEKEM